MSAPPAKRQRVASLVEPDDHQALSRQLDLDKAIKSLSEDTVRRILFAAAHAHLPVQNMVDAEYKAFVAREQATVINFDHYSKSVWKELNVNHGGQSGSRQYDSAYDAFTYVTNVIETISKRATPDSSLGTKISALETLRKIGKSIALSGGDTLGHEVIKCFQTTDVLEEAMSEILESMAEAGCVSGMSDEFIDKLEELIKLGEGRCIFAGLSGTLAFFEKEDENPDEIQGQSSDDGISEVYDKEDIEASNRDTQRQVMESTLGA